MNISRNNDSSGPDANPHWHGVEIRWPHAEDTFVPDVRPRERAARPPVNRRPVEFTWLATLPPTGVVTGLTRSLNVTAEARQEKF